MSADGFIRHHKRHRSNSDLIVIHYEPDNVDTDEVLKFLHSIAKIPERHRGTLFTIDADGMHFQKM